MKICFITSSIFNHGGIQRVLSILANRLSLNYQVDILCTDDRLAENREIYNLSPEINVELNSDLMSNNIIHRIISKAGRVINNKTGLLNNKHLITILRKSYCSDKIQHKFIKYLNDKEYDLVIGVEGDYSLLVGIIAERLRAKTIGWQHNSYDAYFKTQNRYYWNQDELYKNYIKKLDQYIVLTDYDKEMFKKNMQLDVTRIYNPLSFVSKNKSKCSSKNILFVGRLVEKQKGLDFLIESFKKVVSKKTDWKLIIVGDGPDKQKLMDLIIESKLEENVEIVPFTSEVEQYYLNSSILISTSRWEGFGLVITEAMECGLPVIAFSNSGPKEIINKPNENGILVPCGDCDELAKKMVDLIEDEEKRNRIASQAIVRAKDFSIIKIYGEWDKMLHNMIRSEET
ncbi:glycosyltransferase family 4 protein [Clostridium psychrophilum]|uniref:glycosyltransferase family 4 protein n=1 Tax=Clostridium psychrophilum TaxID=132926 RepID=UPI001C0AE01A|nr:glycosyltransferase family 4 protein [Clostridium psychrophilum]MBU3180722.1 glycosyltransferase family 4 protein [Clostridium psychrophilum]